MATIPASVRLLLGKVLREIEYSSFWSILVLEIRLISYRNLRDIGDQLMNQKVTDDRLLRALKEMPKRKRLEHKLQNTIEKIAKGKRLKKREFNNVYDILFKHGS